MEDAMSKRAASYSTVPFAPDSEEAEEAYYRQHGITAERNPPHFFTLVAAERTRQRALWGDTHDDRHTAAEWAHIIATEAVEVQRAENDRQAAMDELVQVAAVAYAAWQALCRAQRAEAQA
jgi:hypothetical protein